MLRKYKTQARVIHKSTNRPPLPPPRTQQCSASTVCHHTTTKPHKMPCRLFVCEVRRQTISPTFLLHKFFKFLSFAIGHFRFFRATRPLKFEILNSIKITLNYLINILPYNNTYYIFSLSIIFTMVANNVRLQCGILHADSLSPHIGMSMPLAGWQSEAGNLHTHRTHRRTPSHTQVPPPESTARSRLSPTLCVI